MQNSMFNPPPNYSGVTIQISNPAVNVGQENPYITNPQNVGICRGDYCYQPLAYDNTQAITSINDKKAQTDSIQNAPNTANNTQGLPQAYPAQYYLNNYNYQNNGNDERYTSNSGEKTHIKSEEKIPEFINESDINPQNGTSYSNGVNTYKTFANTNTSPNNDLTKSNGIIGALDERQAEIEEAKKNTTETKIVALTDEYIKSLENYLDNPNDEIRLMASKEILTRLDEDKDRYNDAALNALLNKMMQDPSKLVRIAALSAFSSGLASGNDYTVKLLHNIQSNPNADKEDVLQAADILLRMTSGTEIKNIPNPSVKDNTNNSKGQ